MKIAISAAGHTLDTEVDPRFGRCPYFVIVDPETMQFEAVANSSAMASGGAGISAAQMIVDKGIQAVLTGSCGPNAYQVLSAAGIKVITGVSGKVKDAVQDYKSGKFQASSQPNVTAHFGSGFGVGAGRGMRMGCGRGGRMMTPVSPAIQPLGLEQELDALKVQSQELATQLSEIQRRIDELEKKGQQDS